MAPDVFLYPGEAAVTDIRLLDPTQLPGAPGELTLASAVTQAAASLTGTLTETVPAISLGTTQANAPAATLAETLSSAAALTQAPATPVSTLVETLTGSAATTQAKAMAALTLVETLTSTAASTQATPVLSASGALLWLTAFVSTQAAASAVIIATPNQDVVTVPPVAWRGAAWHNHPKAVWPFDGALR